MDPPVGGMGAVIAVAATLALTALSGARPSAIESSAMTIPGSGPAAAG